MAVVLKTTCDLCGRVEESGSTVTRTMPPRWVYHSHDLYRGHTCEDCSEALQGAIDDAVENVVEERKGSAAP